MGKLPVKFDSLKFGQGKHVNILLPTIDVKAFLLAVDPPPSHLLELHKRHEHLV